MRHRPERRECGGARRGPPGRREAGLREFTRQSRKWIPKRGSWTAEEEVARESLRGQKLLEQDRNETRPVLRAELRRRREGSAPSSAAGSELEAGRHGSRVKGPPFPQHEFLGSDLSSDLEEEQGPSLTPQPQSQPRGEGKGRGE